MIVTLPLIALRQIGLRTATRVLVTNLSLEVCAGERWAVLGPNGAGKSTLLLALAGARRADAGEVCIDSRRIDAISAQELALRRALLADRWIDTFSSSVLDTVLTARYAAGEGSGDPEGALQWLAELDCAELAARDVRRLSRGERQRVALATTLTQDTPLLLLDEPTAHQDPRHQALVIDVLIGKLKSMSGRGIIATLHDINAAARFATHALLLHGDGRHRTGTAEEALTPETLSDLFATPITRVESEGEAFFHVHWPRDKRV
jgi:iron complex transport system ATP-binding protein